MSQPKVLLSGFADESANQKTAVQQFTAFAALGLKYYTIRFIDAGNGIKNVSAWKMETPTTMASIVPNTCFSDENVEFGHANVKM